MPDVVSRRVERYVQERFDESESESELVLAALGEWRISYEEEPPSERLIAAVVLAADGRFDGVDVACRTAEQDWRGSARRRRAGERRLADGPGRAARSGRRLVTAGRRLVGAAAGSVAALR